MTSGITRDLCSAEVTTGLSYGISSHHGCCRGLHEQFRQIRVWPSHDEKRRSNHARWPTGAHSPTRRPSRAQPAQPQLHSRDLRCHAETRMPIPARHPARHTGNQPAIADDTTEAPSLCHQQPQRSIRIWATDPLLDLRQRRVTIGADSTMRRDASVSPADSRSWVITAITRSKPLSPAQRQ